MLIASPHVNGRRQPKTQKMYTHLLPRLPQMAETARGGQSIKAHELCLSVHGALIAFYLVFTWRKAPGLRELFPVIHGIRFLPHSSVDKNGLSWKSQTSYFLALLAYYPTSIFEVSAGLKNSFCLFLFLFYNCFMRLFKCVCIVRSPAFRK